ncbi:MAG TPA: L-seryl-tRNA(Sec) selenium transferase [bacterium]|nr:L-seryl-tRNA(Sec) selenium transferase [bacterium]
MLKALPSIDLVLAYPEVARLAASYSRELAAEWARAAVEELRAELTAGARPALGPDGKLAPELVAERVKDQAARLLAPSLKRVVNATGIVIHTNLGRAPLSPHLMEAMREVLGTYSNLEFDLAAGGRGSRHVHLARLIRAVTGAEDGIVVNNNAAAVLVALNTLATGREVVVSRGELIEIGGSFRIPDIIKSGGAILREVGTTNKTRLSDYEKVIGPDTALILKVHTSNYKIVGFTEQAELKDLAALGRSTHVPVMLDLGSGLLVDLAAHGITDERPVRHYVEAGADLVTFSGDKLLGGPQAGFIAGKKDVVDRIKQNPMVRALRVGKLTLAALESMLTAYLAPDTLFEKIPALRLLTRPPEEIKKEARKLAAGLKKRLKNAEIKVAEDEAFAGGGSLPASPLPTFVVTVSVPGHSADDLARAFRNAPVPVVGRMRQGVFCLDCRALLPADHALIFAAAEAIGLRE